LFQLVWKKYDPKATGMIAADDLHSIIMDLILEELKQIDSQEKDKKSSVWCGMKMS